MELLISIKIWLKRMRLELISWTRPRFFLFFIFIENKKNNKFVRLIQLIKCINILKFYKKS